MKGFELFFLCQKFCIYFTHRIRESFDRSSNLGVFSERLLGPAVLLHDAFLLFGCEVVLDVEVLADFRDALALDLGSDLRAGKLEQGLDVQVISSHDDFEELFSLNIDVVGVPGFDDLA